MAYSIEQLKKIKQSELRRRKKLEKEQKVLEKNKDIQTKL